MIKSNKSIRYYLPEVGCFFIILLVHAQHLCADFWSDEIYSMKEFILVPITKTLTDYHVPNNHVFANLIDNIYLKVIQVHSLDQLLHRPYLLRVVPFVFVFVTYFYLYKIGAKFFNRSVALLSAGLLVFNLSYINFSLQIRGYGLSAMLLIALIYYLFNALEGKKCTIGLVVTTALLFYTTPSNLLFLLGIGLFLGGKFLIDWKKNKILAVYPLLAFCGGIGLALLFYLVIIKDVFFNEYTVRGESFRSEILIYYVYAIVKSLLWSKWVLLPLGIVGAYFIKKNDHKASIKIALLLSICFVAGVLPFLLGIRAPIRVYSVLLPLSSLLLAVVLDAFWEAVVKKKQTFFVFGILLYSAINLAYWEYASSKKIALQNTQDQRSQNIYYQYYSFHYNPLKELQEFKKDYDASIPVIVNLCEPYGITYYLKAENIPYTLVVYQEKEGAVDTKKPFYLITAGDKTIGRFDQKKINKDGSYHSIYLIEPLR